MVQARPPVLSLEHTLMQSMPGGAAVISHDDLVRGRSGRPTFVIVRDDGSGLPPVGVNNNLAPLVPVTQEDMDEAARILASAPGMSAPSPTPVAHAPVTHAPAPVVLAGKSVTFVSEIMDLEVPCLDVVHQPELGLFSLIVPVSVTLKLKMHQEVTIRDSTGEHVYQFTGILVPVTVLNARLLVFGINS